MEIKLHRILRDKISYILYTTCTFKFDVVNAGSLFARTIFKTLYLAKYKLQAR